MRISLIITTYNWKEALALSLKSALAQKQDPFEIIVADDGSDEGTARLIHKVTSRSSIPIIHSWQEDKGFRLSASRNKAIAKASGDYIILVDGDIVQERHFIYDHVRFAHPGFFVQGSRVLLSQKLSSEVLQAQKLSHAFCRRGVANKKNCIRSKVLARLFSLKNKNINGVRTCNFAFWRKDAIAVNGFNEEFVGWGREDSEFTARLINSGLMRRNIKFNALTYHLYHPINDRSHLHLNDKILEDTILKKRYWCKKGLDQYLV
jgi:glycosyltransferase involved in cell wall biosynthesis